MKIKFSKMHGLGNDFVVIDNLQLQHEFSQKEVRWLADRKYGVGCDQVLIVDQASDNISDFFYRIFNNDGTVAAQCGNGARAVIKFIHALGLSHKNNLCLQTLTRRINCQLHADGSVEVAMGVPEFNPDNIPLLLAKKDYYLLDSGGAEIRFAAVSMGNPHAVIWLEDPKLLQDDEYLCRIAVVLQHSEIFPDSVNVNFAFIEDNNILLKTYERGSGFTLACGSGACATAAIARRDKLIGAQTVVQMPGGNLAISFTLQGEVLMRGGASYVFDGEIELCQ